MIHQLAALGAGFLLGAFAMWALMVVRAAE